MNGFDAGDLQTETFSNARGWTTVRVTHGPSTIAVERSRTESLRSAVQAQRECIDEIRKLLADRRWPGRGEETAAAASTGRPAPSRSASGSPSAAASRVSRAELDGLTARVAQLEERLAGLEAASGQKAGTGPT